MSLAFVLFLPVFQYEDLFHKSYFVRHVLHKYTNEDVSLGSWFIGLDVEHIDDRRLCCGTPPGNILNNTDVCVDGMHR